jgi:hypothetical protein
MSEIGHCIIACGRWVGKNVFFTKQVLRSIIPEKHL